MIRNPITLQPSATLREAVALMARFRISGVPVVDATGKLVGIITNRDCSSSGTSTDRSPTR